LKQPRLAQIEAAFSRDPRLSVSDGGEHVETLAGFALIIERGAPAYAAIGHREKQGDEASSAQRSYRQPGVTSWKWLSVQKVLEEDCGGVPGGKNSKA